MEQDNSIYYAGTRDGEMMSRFSSDYSDFTEDVAPASVAETEEVFFHDVVDAPRPPLPPYYPS